MNRIDAILEHAKGPQVLDLGSVQHDLEKTQRDDWLHEHLVRAFDRVIAVDILCEEVEALNQQGYEMVCQDVEELDVGMTFDTVVAGELIEHLSNPGKMLDSVKPHLKDGGQLILTTPNPFALVRVRRGPKQEYINAEHTGWYGPVTMEQLLARHGYEMYSYTGIKPKHKGLMRFARYMGIDYLASTTWLFIAQHQ